MRTLPAVLVVLAVLSGASGCGSKNSPMPPPNWLAARTSAADAVVQIAAARCLRDERCYDPSEPTNYQRCHIYVKTDLDKSFRDNTSCKNGVALDDLERCLGKIRGNECGFRGAVREGLDTSMACGSAELCLR
jgi:hypothetical protein